MKIVILADNRKNELLSNFCVAYSHILESHELYSLFHTAKLLESSTGLVITGISTDIDSSLDQLASRARYNEVDAVIYIQDPSAHDYGRPNTLLEACDLNNIPYASNLASAELLVLAIDRGDLDWRELVRP
ncbi:MAG: methylglyoxal synthase [Fastidiosipilaceae bacterium]